MPKDREYKAAKKRVKKKKDFYSMLLVFAILTPFLFLLNLFTTPSHWWFIYPTLGFIVATGFGYAEAFGIPGKEKILSPEWEEREIEKELNRNSPSNWDDSPTIPDNELELKEFKKLREEWNDQDFV